MSNTLGAVIKELRERKGILQQDMAEKIGVSVQSISNIERDRQYPSQKHLEAIATALKIPIQVIEALSINPKVVEDPERQEPLEKAFKSLKLLIRDVYDLT